MEVVYMKFLITGDWHLDEKKPKNRTETYVGDQKHKMRQIMKIASNYKVDAILQPGDFFNTSKLSDGCKAHWIRFFKYWDIPIYTIPGQHDMRYHSSDIKNTPLGVLQAAGVVEIMGEGAFGCVKNSMMSPERNVYIHGAGWEQDIPEIRREESINILLLHMLISDKPLYPGHANVNPGWILNKYKYDLIVSGDNHKSFMSPKGKQKLVNCGSLMRSSIDQRDHRPIVYIYNTDSNTIRDESILVKPFEEVMNIEEAKKEKERNKELEDFVEGLSDTNIEGLDFKKNLIDHLTKNKDKISDGVIDIINEVIE
jgi:exonuclease SbcC